MNSFFISFPFGLSPSFFISQLMPFLLLHLSFIFSSSILIYLLLLLSFHLLLLLHLSFISLFFHPSIFIHVHSILASPSSLPLFISLLHPSYPHPRFCSLFHLLISSFHPPSFHHFPSFISLLHPSHPHPRFCSSFHSLIFSSHPPSLISSSLLHLHIIILTSVSYLLSSSLPSLIPHPFSSFCILPPSLFASSLLSIILITPSSPSSFHLPPPSFCALFSSPHYSPHLPRLISSPVSHIHTLIFAFLSPCSLPLISLPRGCSASCTASRGGSLLE